MGHQTGQARGSGHGTAAHGGRTGRSTGQRRAWPRSQLHQACTPEQPAKHPGRRTAHVLREMTRAVRWSMRYWSKSWALAPDYRRKGGRGILFLGEGEGVRPTLPHRIERPARSQVAQPCGMHPDTLALR